MAEQAVQLIAFNRGIISKYALARIDLERMRMSAEIQTNWMPRVFGAMMLRAGLGYTGLGPDNNVAAKCIPFIRSTSDVVRVELADSIMRVLIGNTPLTRPAVSATVTNGNFNTDLSSWNNGDGSGATSAWASPNYMSLKGNSFNSAIRTQTVTVSNPGVEHALRIVVVRGPVRLRVGSTSGADDLFNEQELGTGNHSIAFTPAGNFTIYFANTNQPAALVDSCNIEVAGIVRLPTPWPIANVPNVRWDQSADVLYLCDGSVQQMKIERFGARSWAIVNYEADDGPFLIINTSSVTIAASAISGDVTLTASDNVFRSTHVGALFRLASGSQNVDATLTGGTQFSGPVRVAGVGTSRAMVINISGTWAGTLTLQQSPGAPGSWTAVKTFTGNQTNFSYNDTLDNQIMYYRIGFATGGDYVSGTADTQLFFSGGSISGIARITSFSSATSVGATVLMPFGDTNPTTLWYEGSWSDYRGWPSEVKLHEGRLWWMGVAKYFGSVSDAYESFDDTVIGDSGPIQSSIGFGPVDTINWSLSLERLLSGTDGNVISARSDAILSPLTPTNFNLKAPASYGSARVAAIKVDFNGYFVERSGFSLYELIWTASYYNPVDYTAKDATSLAFEVCKPGIVRMAVQRKPDTRIHCVLSDGTVSVYVLDKLEQVECWVKLVTTGTVEDVVVLPGAAGSYEDMVYYTVVRPNGNRCYETFALETECRGGTLNKQADSFALYSGSATNVMTAIAPHLAGQQVVVWADGMDYSPRNPDNTQQTYLVANDGTVTMGAGVTVSNAVVGLSYTAQFKSVKMAYAAQTGSALTKTKRIGSIAPLMADTHYQGLQYGHDLDDTLDELPLVEAGIATPANTVWDTYDNQDFTFPGEWDTDSRLCLQAMAPRPCNLLGVIVDMETEG